MRLFVAVELSDAMKSALEKLQRRLGRFDADVRWTGREQMHLTLKFLGEVPDSDVPGVCTAAGLAAESSAPLEMSLASCGCFPPHGPVRTVWTGLETAGGELSRCQRALEECLAEAGYEPERRPFTPHLTLGRVRDGKRPHGLREAVEAAKADTAHQAVEDICVFESQLGPGGARHTIISRHRLGAAAGTGA